MNKEQEDLVIFLLENNALQFGEFTFKSGRICPYYYNARSISTGKGLEKICKVYASLAEKIGLQNFDVLFGPAYAGIPLVTGTTLELAKKGTDKRFAFDRKETKEYGDAANKNVIGEIRDGDRVLIIDDVVTTGKTKLEVRDKIASIAKVHFVGIIICVDRCETNETGEITTEFLKQNGLPVYSALNAIEVFEYLHNHEINGKVWVDDKMYNSFKAYQAKYGAKKC